MERSCWRRSRRRFDRPFSVQVFILDSISNYGPKDEREAQSICERITPRLAHANAAVVLSAVKGGPLPGFATGFFSQRTGFGCLTGLLLLLLLGRRSADEVDGDDVARRRFCGQPEQEAGAAAGDAAVVGARGAVRGLAQHQPHRPEAARHPQERDEGGVVVATFSMECASTHSKETESLGFFSRCSSSSTTTRSTSNWRSWTS